MNQRYQNTATGGTKSPILSGISFSIPVYQWGINKNKREIAKNEYEETMIEIEDTQNKFQSQIKEHIFEYNNSVCLFDIAKQKYELALQKYEFSAIKYDTGKMSSIDLVTANNDCLSAKQEYINTITSLYVNYYHIRHISLHDYMTDTDLMELFDGKK